MLPSIPHTDAPRLKFARALVFVASFCLMTIELVASRVMAPYLGVSLYTWTSVIGSVLLGVTIGNVLGGRLADRRLSRRTLGSALALAGIATLGLAALAPVLGPLLGASSLPFPVAAILFSCLVFFPAACCLSTVTPLVVKFDLHDLEKTGATIGTIGAWSAAGSIVGTFSTGFLFIAFLGTRLLLLGIGGLLILLGILVALEHKLWKSRLTALAGLFFVGNVVVPGACQIETNYYCIRITQTVDTAGAAYTLRLDHLVHSFVHPGRPDALGYAYENVYTNLLASRHAPGDAFSALFLGGGGYVLPRYLDRFYRQASVTVAEIDPGVTAANYDRMGLPRTTAIKTVNGDARMTLAKQTDGQKYEFVFGDAFNDFSVPFHLTTVEFNRLLKSRMTPDGVYALNVIDDPVYGQFFSSLTRTLQAVWKYVYVAPQAEALTPGRNTIILMASDVPIDPVKWRNARPPHDSSTPIDEAARQRDIAILPDAAVEAFLAAHPAPVLTDDFAPTDRELAPVFKDAY